MRAPTHPAPAEGEEQLVQAWEGPMEQAAHSLLGARREGAAAAERAKQQERDVDYDEQEEDGFDCSCHTALWCDRVATSEDLKRCVVVWSECRHGLSYEKQTLVQPIP